jgi:predicted metal-binding membrane protein
MSEMGEMPMPGGWTMSMAWMRMPGQSWTGAAASFLGMWTAMMVAMMLPSVWPALRRYRAAAGSGRLTAVVGAGYFLVWAACGAVAFPVGVALAALEMEHVALARLVPVAIGAVVLVAGASQLTTWKARQLACCREAPAPAGAGVRAAWRHGLRLGWDCVRCCAGATASLLVIGVMDLRAMLVVTIAITLERLAPAGLRIARATGAACVVAGMALIARAIG